MFFALAVTKLLSDTVALQVFFLGARREQSKKPPLIDIINLQNYNFSFKIFILSSLKLCRQGRKHHSPPPLPPPAATPLLRLISEREVLVSNYGFDVMSPGMSRSVDTCK